MSKTVEELHEIYRNARLGEIFAAKDEELVTDVRKRAERAGIAAVIRAVRDDTAINSCACKFWLDDILGDAGMHPEDFQVVFGDAGNEKVAGASKVTQGTIDAQASSANTPATDPAPAVCEITAERDRLAGEVERLKETITAAVQFNEGLAAERDRTRADYDAMKAHNKELFGKLSDAETERDRLKAALQVIASDPTHSGQAMVARKALGGDA